MKAIGTRSRILVVEDEALIAEEIYERLTRLGYEVVGRESTASGALRSAKREDPDLVLMDIRLKGQVDGIDAAERICHELHVPVVYVTAHSDGDTLRRARASEPFGFVLKPFKEKDLVIAIEMALGRHAAERRLYESERRYVTTLRSIGDGVIATDPENRVTFMNPAAERLTGWSLAEADGSPVDEVMRLAGDEASRLHPVHEAVRDRSPIHLAFPVDLLSRSGEVARIEDSAAPILGEKGELLGAVMAFRDCSRREAIQETLRQTERRLEEAKRMEALGRLAGGVAHDFNNALTTVIVSAELLRYQIAGKGDAEPLVRSILEAADRASALTDQLLAYGRKCLVTPSVVELNGVIRGLEELLARTLGDSIALHLELTPEPLWVRVEKRRLEQVLINLATNARDALEGRPGSVVLETECGPRGQSILRVRDDGVGMDEETRSRVFEPFFTTKARGRGTGLGLATVFGTIKQFEGEIAVESTPGAGTTFTIRLPVVSELPEVPGGPVPPSDARGHETVLLVEDDSALRHMASASLMAYGYTVVPAEDGPSALEAFDENETIDVLVTDLVLPGWSGRNVADLLCAKRPDLPVLYISGHTEDEVVRRGLVDERINLLRKPFTPQALASRVRETLDRWVPGT